MFRSKAIVVLVLLAMTLAVYWQVRNFEFLNYDDDVYISSNDRIHDGLTGENIRWAFTTGYVSNWHPLTWLSHMLDCQLYGLDPEGHHLTNLVFHLVNTILLFLALNKMTGAVGRSAFVAALFAIHPLHVESVAWVAERKDVLSGCFWMLTMIAYAHYAKHPRPRNYLLVVVAFALGLLAKPMLVTLPFVLLLMDYWPLARLRIEGPVTGGAWARYWPMIREKIPLFALAAALCMVTALVQQQGGAVKSLVRLALPTRIVNALVSYAVYLAKTFWPTHLAVFYPHRGTTIPLSWVAMSCALLLAVTILAIWAAKRRPYLFVGWFWFLGTLVPVIGIVQVGVQALADRYTYLPQIGIFLMVAWGVPEVLAGWKHAKRVVPTTAVAALVVLMVCCWFQVRHWRSSETLFRHALRVTVLNPLAHNNLGSALMGKGERDEAREHFVAAIAIKPDFAQAHYNLASVLAAQRNLEEARKHYLEAIRLDPSYVNAYNRLGVVLALLGDTEGAIELFLKTLSMDPDNFEAYMNLGVARAQQGQFDKAFELFQRALEIRPQNAVVHYRLGTLFGQQDKLGEAGAHFVQAVTINPKYVDAHFKLGKVLEALGRTEQARRQYLEVLRLDPSHAKARTALKEASEESGSPAPPPRPIPLTLSNPPPAVPQ